jgi:uncharacterized phage infection (PIP) family protein YhgE
MFMLVDTLHIHMATTTATTDINLDWISRGILVALNDNGATTTTSEIKTLTGVTEGTKVPYRLKNKLAPAGLVELTRPGIDENGQTLPLEVTLTDHGTDLAQQLEDYEDVTDTPDITEYTDKLDARVTRIESQLDQLDTDAESGPDPSDLQAQLTELDEKLEALYRNMTRFRDYLNKRDDGGYSEYVEQQEQQR